MVARDDQVGLSRYRTLKNSIIRQILKHVYRASRAYNSCRTTYQLKCCDDISFGLIEFGSEDTCGFGNNRN